jgi:hypothetical protein
MWITSEVLGVKQICPTSFASGARQIVQTFQPYISVVFDKTTKDFWTPSLTYNKPFYGTNVFGTLSTYCLGGKCNKYTHINWHIVYQADSYKLTKMYLYILWRDAWKPE